MISFQLSSAVVRPAVSATAAMEAFIPMMRGGKEMMSKVTGFMRVSLVLGQLLGVHVG